MAPRCTFTQKIADEICERLSNGENLRAICRDSHMPAWRTIYDWMGEFPDFNAAIARAREVGADAIAESIIEILDEPPERTATEHGDKVDAGYVAWQKNRAEQRLKLLAKWQPKKYGERVNLDHSGEIALEKLTDAQIDARIAALTSGQVDGDGSA